VALFQPKVTKSSRGKELITDETRRGLQAPPFLFKEIILTQGSIRNVKVSSQEIALVIDSIIEATTNFEDSSLILGCIATAIVTCKPTIGGKALTEGTKLLSESLAMWLATEGMDMVIN
jgi:hypothetical protein